MKVLRTSRRTEPPRGAGGNHPAGEAVAHDGSLRRNTRASRRDMLSRAGAAGALAALGTVARPVAASAGEGNGFGAYLITVASSTPGQSMFQAVLALAAGGVAIAVSAMPRGTHLGTWQSGGSMIRVRLIAYQFDSSGNNTGYLQVDASGPLPGPSIRCAYTVTFFPVSGGSQVVDQGTLSGNQLPA